MDDLCYRTKAIVQQVPQDLADLENLIISLNSTETDKQPLFRLEHKISQALETVVSNCQRLNVLSNNEAPRRRSQIQVAIDQIQSECKFLRSNLQNLQRKRASKEQELLHRASLFAMPSAATNGTTPGAAVVRLDTQVDEFSRLTTVGRRLDEMLMSGSESLSALKEQRNTLKGTQRRVLDLMNTLGLSNAVMRLIQRRSHQDKVLFYVLCVATLILMWGLWRFIRG